MEPSHDFLAWLAQHKPSLYGAVLALAFAHRWLSVMVGRRKRPVEGERFYKLWLVLGQVSGAAWADAPVSVKTILGPMPSGVVTAEGGFRSGDTNPKISGTFARVDPPKIPPAVLVIGFLFAFGSGCVTTAIDKARVEYGRALKAQTQIQSRFKLQQKELQRKNITRLGIHTPAAAQWQAEWIVKKAPVEDQIRRCQAILDETSDYLLLSDDKRGISGAGAATACVSAMKDQISKLFDGGL